MGWSFQEFLKDLFFLKGSLVWQIRQSFPKLPPSSVVIYDRILGRKNFFQKWVASYPSHAVRGGESLKSIDAFPQNIRKILKLTQDLEKPILVGVGGGSVGDFVGFCASVLRRGCPLIHIPSTWLSAIDSAHGGKTALNVDAKNQIGTFKKPLKVFLVRELLESQPERRAAEALGELLKMALLDGGGWFEKVRNALPEASSSFLLSRFLREAIQGKYRIIEKDYLEISGGRRVLNLGHTLGHVLEVSHSLPHGVAVYMGLWMSVEWSLQKKFLSQREYKKVRSFFQTRIFQKSFKEVQKRKLSPRKFLFLLGKDKKRVKGQKIDFVFLKGIGRPYRYAVSFLSLLKECQRQGWVKE
ncbi:MAG: hypothetical protein D6797_02695 [Bdellovibrio sp.]|nr:MAG: hypothetical protein D6797_02695 [Bdellovibrio sp.]